MTTPRNRNWESNLRLLRPNWNSHGAKPITEEAIQVGAKEIHKQATVPRSGPQERQVAAIRKARRKEIKERNEVK